MKFSISISLERFDPAPDMRRVAAHALELVQIAEEGGFEIAWTPEHHTIELTIAPNPFSILTHWAAHTKTIRLGTAVVVAPYWHPIRAAAEAALCDVFSNGRLEFGIGRGAYQFEFDRMAGGMPQERGGAYMREMLPAVKALGRATTSITAPAGRSRRRPRCPSPAEAPSAHLGCGARRVDLRLGDQTGRRHPVDTLSRPNAEVEILGKRLQEALAANPQAKKPRFMMLRRTSVFESARDAAVPINASIYYGRHFENLFKNIGAVPNGFPSRWTWAVANRNEYEPDFVRENMMFGTPDEVVRKIRFYQACGVDNFCYGASFGLDYEAQLRSLRLFISDVMPHFRSDAPRERAASAGRH